VAEPTQHDFGDVDEIDVESIGEPGHRTFRFLAEEGTRTASLWVEKEQLQAFALIVDQQIARFAHRRAVAERTLLTLAGRFPAQPTVDFKVGRMAVGYDEAIGKFVLTASDVEGEADFSCRATQPQVEAVSAKIADVVAAGRPRCPLCGAPIEGKHVCPASNGHAR
jgi:uncharacterized repeat protein (TIGR03847 family)